LNNTPLVILKALPERPFRHLGLPER